MERQALRTDVAFAKLGATMDTVGGRQTVRNLEQTDRALRNMGRTENVVSRENDRLSTSFKRVNRDADGFWVRIRKVGASLIGLGKIIQVLKLPVMIGGIIAAVGLLVQAVVQLGGGIVALVPKVADLAGAIAPLPALIAGMGFTMLTVKLATSGLSQALGGNQKALERLTPTARRFVDTLKLYKPVLDDLRRSAQEGLFGGLDTALRRLQRGVPTIDRLLSRYSRMLGGLAAGAARRTTTPQFLRNLEAVGNQGAFIVERLGQGFLNLVEAVLDFAVAARPFTRWITETLVHFSRWIQAASLAGRQSGRFQEFLERTRRSMIQFGHILRDTWFLLRNIGRAARPLGDDLWDSAEKAVRGWRQWTGATENRLRMIRDFNAMGEGIHEIVGLVSDLAGALYRVGTQPGLPGMVKGLRDLVPVLERIVTVVTAALGPPLVDALNEVARLLENLTGASGPLGTFLRLFSNTLRVINELIENIPALGTVITAALTVTAVNIFITRVQKLALSWWEVSGAATAAARAQVAATGGGIATAATAGGLILPGGRAAAAGAGPGRWVSAPGGGRAWETAAEVGTGAAAAGGMRGIFRGGMRGAPGRAGTALAARGGVGGIARLGLRAGGKLALPVAAVMAGLDALTAQREGNVGYQALQTGSAALSGATFGLIPRVRTGTEQMGERERRMMEGYTRREGGIPQIGSLLGPGSGLGMIGRRLGFGRDVRQQGIAEGLQQRLQRFGGAEGPQNLRDVRGRLRVMRQYAQTTADFTSGPGRAYHQQLLADIEAHKQLNSQLTAARLQQQRLNRARVAARSVRTADVGADRLGRRFNVRAGQVGVEKAMDETTGLVTRLMQTLEPAGRKRIGQAALTWAAEARKQNPKLKDEYVTLRKGVTREFEKAGDNVKIVNTRVLSNSKRQWRSIRNTLVQESQLAKVGLAQNFGQIQAMAVGSLTAMGYSRSEAAGIVQGIVATGRPGGALPTSAADTSSLYGRYENQTNPGGRARGGRVPGRGLHDHVLLGRGGAIGAPGEMVVNRHTEARINRMLSMAGTSLEREVGREGRPHSAPMRGYQRGGRVTGDTDYSPALGLALRRMAAGTNTPISVTSGGRSLAEQAALYASKPAGMAARPSANAPHVRGIAADISPGWETFGAHAGRYGLSFPLLGTPYEPWHIELAGARGGGGATSTLAAQINLRAPRVRQRGIPGALGQRGADLFAGGLSRRLNESVVAAAGMPSEAAPTPAGGGGNAANMKLAQQMLAARGWGGQWGALRSLWMGESGFRHTARNPSSGAYGIPQALPASKMASAGADWQTNPATQIKWGLDYIGGRYGNPAAAYAAWQSRSPHWYGQGGRLDWGGWFADGGRMTARRPTMIGVGERGAETVTVTKAGRGGDGINLNVTVPISNINYNQPGDVRTAIEAEVGRALSNVASMVKSATDEGDVA